MSPSTFDLMYTGGLRNELLGYWLTLSMGPLYLSDPAHRMYVQSSRYQMTEGQRLLSDLDTAASIGLTEKEARKLLMKNQMTPYDLVQEFCVSMEHWMTTVKPTTTRMLQMLDQIGSFMTEFSQHCSVRPPFLRLPLDIPALETGFGVQYAPPDNSSYVVDLGITQTFASLLLSFSSVLFVHNSISDPLLLLFNRKKTTHGC